MSDFWKGKKVLVTGGSSFLASHLLPLLDGADVAAPSSKEFDLRSEAQARGMFARWPGADVLFHLAADVGGIGYNRAHGARLLRDNALMGLHVLKACDARKAVVVGSTCGYPKHCPVPFREEDFFDGYPEETNAPYGIAKRVLLAYLEAGVPYGWCFAIPTNLYGERDCFDEGRSHVIPALIKRFLKARDWVTVWGSGEPTRDFLHAGDCARGLALLAERGEGRVNLGSGREVSIRGLVKLVGQATNYHGQVAWDETMPDGQPRRLLDVSRARALGWEPEVGLEDGLRRTVEWWRSSVESTEVRGEHA